MLLRSYRVRSSTIVAVAALAACSKAPEQKVPPVPVELAAVSTIAAPLAIESNGVVEPAQTVTVQGQVTGTIQSVGFREGEDVTEGQVLFQLDPRPFEAALRQAEALRHRSRLRATTVDGRASHLLTRTYEEQNRKRASGNPRPGDRCRLPAGRTAGAVPIRARCG